MNKVLLVGTGGCGNKLLNTAMNILNSSMNLQCSYDCVFVNSNENEMKILSNYSGLNSLPINGNGTGRNSAVAKKSIANERSKFTSFFNANGERYDLAFILTSADGGFGNGSTPLIASVLKSIKEDMIVGVLGAMPVKSSRAVSFENALAFHNDMVELRDAGIINTIQYIDNNKLVDEDKFNGKVMKSFIESLEFNYGAVDANDVKEIHGASNYKVILPLKSELSFDIALTKAWKDSPFLMPKEYKATHVAGTLLKGSHDKEEIFENIDGLRWDKVDFGEKSYIILCGCEMPNEYIENIRYLYDELTTEVEEEPKSNDKVDFSVKPRKSKPTLFAQKSGKKELTKEERMKMMWDSYFSN